MFVGSFAYFTIAHILDDRFWEREQKNEALEQTRTQAARICHALWERGLLEREEIEENLFLYRLHPILRVFAREFVNDFTADSEIHWRTMKGLADSSLVEIKKSPLVAQIISHAIPDLLIAAKLYDTEIGAGLQYTVSRLLKQFGLFSEAMKLLNKSYIICNASSYEEGKSLILREKADINVIWGNFDEALNLYKQSEEIDESLNRLSNKANTLYEMAYIYVLRGNFDYALNIYQQVLKIKEELGDTDKGAILNDMAQLYVKRKDLHAAKKLYLEALEIAENKSNLVDAGTAKGALSQIYMMQGDLDEAMKLCQESVGLSEKLGDPRGKNIAMSMLATIYAAKNDLENALKIYQQVLRISKELNDSYGIA